MGRPCGASHPAAPCLVRGRGRAGGRVRARARVRGRVGVGVGVRVRARVRACCVPATLLSGEWVSMLCSRGARGARGDN